MSCSYPAPNRTTLCFFLSFCEGKKCQSRDIVMFVCCRGDGVVVVVVAASEGDMRALKARDASDEDFNGRASAYLPYILYRATAGKDNHTKKPTICVTWIQDNVG